MPFLTERYREDKRSVQEYEGASLVEGFVEERCLLGSSISVYKSFRGR